MSLKKQLILTRERWLNSFSEQWQSIQLPVAKKTLHQILVCLPEENSYSPTELIQEYQDLFVGSSLLFCAVKDMVEQIPVSLNCLYYQPTELPFWRKLTDSLNQTLAAHQFEMALDLNTTLSLPAAMICIMTKAPIRVSFAKPNADLFFNVQVQIQRQGQSMQNKLTVFHKHLFPLLHNRKQTEPKS